MEKLSYLMMLREKSMYYEKVLNRLFVAKQNDKDLEYDYGKVFWLNFDNEKAIRALDREVSKNYFMPASVRG